MKLQRVRKMRAQQRDNQRKNPSNRENPYFQREKKSLLGEVPEPVRQWLRTDGLAIGGIGVLCVVTGWYFGFHTERFMLSDIQINGLQFIAREDVNAALDRYTQSTVFGIVARNTYWTANEDALREALQESLAHNYALDSVTVEKTFPNHLTVSIRERIPQVTWITTNDSGEDAYYTVDRQGRVAQALSGSDAALPDFPVVRDQNNKTLIVGAQVVSPDYLSFLLNLNERFPEGTGLSVESFIFPPIECKQKQYVTEKIIEDEILDSQSEEFKNQKRTILEQFQNGNLTVDQSLTAIEEIKRQEMEKLGQEGTSAASNLGVYQWQAVYVPTDCDYTKVARDVYIVTGEDAGGFTVYMDSAVDPVIQMQNVRSVLQTTISDRTEVQYIDARFIDRVYYQ